MTANKTTTPRIDATHYTHAAEPVSRYGWTSAVCGARVNEHWSETDDQAPTCPACRAWLDERNAEADDRPVKYSRTWNRERLGVSGDRDE